MYIDTVTIMNIFDNNKYKLLKTKKIFKYYNKYKTQRFVIFIKMSIIKQILCSYLYVKYSCMNNENKKRLII